MLYLWLYMSVWLVGVEGEGGGSVVMEMEVEMMVELMMWC